MNDPSFLPTEAPHGPALAGLLERAHRRLLALDGLVGLGIVLGGGGVLVASWSCLLGLHFTPALRLWGLGLMVALGAAVPVGLGLVRRRLIPRRVARLLTRDDPRRRSLLLSAVELEKGFVSPGISLQLIRAQAAYAERELRDLDVFESISDGPARTALTFATLWLVLVGALVKQGPDPFARGFALLLAGDSGVRASAAAEPITGDLELTLFFPSHTRLAPRTITGTNGELEVPAGTEVRLRTRTDRPVQEAAVVVNGASIPLVVTGERRLAGKFTILKGGSYRFRFGPAKHPIAEGPPISIAVQVDAPPQVILSSPAENLEVEPGQVVDLRYQATDDYGLSELRLAFRAPGSKVEQTRSLQKPEDPPTHLEGTARFDLRTLNLGPGDEVIYALEALDNDSVQGPKSARSRPHRLKVFSEAEHHREGLERVRALWERLLAVLADRLDEEQGAPGGGEAADGRALILSGDMRETGAALNKDRLRERSLATALLNAGQEERRRASITVDARAVTPASGRLLARALADEATSLEQAVLYLEALLDQATVNDLLSMTKELAERRRELTELVERYRKRPTPELKGEIQALVSRIRSRMGELIKRRMELASHISDEHLNREAIEAMAKDKGLGVALDKVDRELGHDDIDGALKTLDQMAGLLNEVQEELRGSQERHSQAYSELAQKLADAKVQLDTVQHAEQQIAEQTEALRQQTRHAAEQKAPATPALLERLRAEAERARLQLEPIPDATFPDPALAVAKKQSTALGQALKARDLAEALGDAEDALQAVASLEMISERFANHRRLDPTTANEPAPPMAQAVEASQGPLREAGDLLQSVRIQLAKLFPDERSLLTPKQQRQVEQLGQEQRRNQEATQRLSKKLEQIGHEAPVLDPEAQEAIEDAAQRMQQAGDHLSKHEAGHATEQEHGALDRLRQFSEAMSKGQGAGQGKANGPRIPNPFMLSEPSTDGDGDDGEANQEKVVVPGADQYQVPAEFRRDILDAMKQQAPHSFEDQVKRYYQEIVK